MLEQQPDCPAITLRTMTDEERERFIRTEVDDYAADLVRAFDIPLDQAQTQSARGFAELEGGDLAARGHYLWTMIAPNGEAVGSLWVYCEASVGLAFLYDIVVREDQRGQGIGTQAMALVEERVRSMGMSRLRLNVFAFNDIARRLYERQGFVPTNIYMQKRL